MAESAKTTKKVMKMSEPNEPITIQLPAGLRSVFKAVTPFNVICLILLLGMGYYVYTNKTIGDSTVIPEAAEVVDYDWGDIDEEKIGMIKSFAEELAKLPEKDWKSKAKILSTMDLESMANDDERLTALNDAMMKAYQKDSAGVRKTLDALISNELTNEAGDFMAASVKKKKK